jgi:hypothetical protein
MRVLRIGKTAEQIATLMKGVSVCYDDLPQGINTSLVEHHETAVRTAFAKMGMPATVRWTAIPNGVGGHIFCLDAGDYVARFSEADLDLEGDAFEKLITENQRRHE